MNRQLQRTGIWAVIGAVHVAALVALDAARPLVARVAPAAPIEVSFLPERERTWEPVTVTASLQPVALEVPAPEVMIATAEPPPTNAISVPAAPAAPRPQVVSAPATPKVVSEVEYVRPPAPRYPAESRRAREEGLVVLRVLVDEHGRARDVKVEKSSGFARLDEAARAAVLRALFKPYVENGVAQAAIVIVPIEFGVRVHRTALARR